MPSDFMFFPNFYVMLSDLHFVTTNYSHFPLTDMFNYLCVVKFVL